MKANWLRIVCTLTVMLGFASLPGREGLAAGTPATPFPPPARTLPTSPRPAPSPRPDAHVQGPPGYCDSIGGNSDYERIESITLVRQEDGTLNLVVQVYIANPDDCQTGTPCPQYDSSPEYLNVWIDWDGDHTWEASELVERELTGYANINYEGTMTAVAPITPPGQGVTEDPTWLRANLGWGYDPNDPCDYDWLWGDVVDQQFFPTRPEIRSIWAQGVGTLSSNPETRFPVRLRAELDVPSGFDVTSCSWIGDLVPGMGDPDNACQYQYTPAAGTYGTKNITLTIGFRHVSSGASGHISREHSFKLFFSKGISTNWGDDDGDHIPNWFEYWGHDHAVPFLADANVRYNATFGAGSYGRTTYDPTQIEIGPSAAGVHYPVAISVPSATGCPGGTFGGIWAATGIDCATEVAEHEHRHGWIDEQWHPGGGWVGQTDSDLGHPTSDYFDWLPNNYETSTNHTLTTVVDSCNLQTYKHAEYRFYGDNEWEVMVYARGRRGVAANDWANPGKQSYPPFAGEEAAPWAGLSTDSGPAGPAAAQSAPQPLLPGLASLTGSYWDYGVDEDADWKYDWLKVGVGVQVDTPATYNVVAWLKGATGTEIAWANSQAQLPAGAQDVELLFDGSLIRNSGLDGPYHLDRVELTIGDEAQLVDAADDAYVTQGYTASVFDPDDASYSGLYSDTGLDTNGDSMYEVLAVDVGLDVHRAGEYTLAAELHGSGPLATASTTAVLAPGLQTVRLEFPGSLLFQHRVDGPYQLHALEVRDASQTRVVFLLDAYSTSAYSYSWFQHGGTLLDPASYTDQGLDMDSDGDYDYLRIQFQVYTDSPGAYLLHAQLKDAEGGLIAQTYQDLLLSLVGYNPVTLDFPAGAIYDHAVDGPYVLSAVALLDGNGAIIDQQEVAHTTQAYAYTGFAPPLIVLPGVYQDFGSDADGDGWYDTLDFHITVVPGDAGNVVAHGRLLDPTGKEIQWAETLTAMAEGYGQVVTLSFDGERIFANHQDGPFELRDLLVYHTADPLQGVFVAQAHTSAAYSYREFEGASWLWLPLVLRSASGAP